MVHTEPATEVESVVATEEKSSCAAGSAMEYENPPAESCAVAFRNATDPPTTAHALCLRDGVEPDVVTAGDGRAVQVGHDGVRRTRRRRWAAARNGGHERRAQHRGRAPPGAK